MANLSAISYAIRMASSAQYSLKLSHAQQIVAAALGHNTHASYQAANEDAALAVAANVVIDPDLLVARAEELGISVPTEDLVRLVRKALTDSLPGAAVHDDIEGFQSALQHQIENELENEDDVASAIADCNHDGVSYVDMPVELAEEVQQAQVGQPFIVPLAGVVSLNPDHDRPYTGHKIKVSANLMLTRLGRRCFDEPSLSASRVVNGDYDDDEDVTPRRSLAQILSDHTGLALEVAQAVAEIDAIVNASEDGLIYSHIYDCEGVLDADYEEAVRMRFPNMQIIVPGHVLDA